MENGNPAMFLLIRSCDVLPEHRNEPKMLRITEETSLLARNVSRLALRIRATPRALTPGSLCAFSATSRTVL